MEDVAPLVERLGVSRWTSGAPSKQQGESDSHSTNVAARDGSRNSTGVQADSGVVPHPQHSPFVATVPTEISQLDFIGNGATVLFPIPYPIQDATDLVVYLTLSGSTTRVLQVLGVNYTVDAAPSNAPNVTMLVAPPNLSTIHVERTVLIVQLINLLSQGAMSPATFTQMFDKRTMVEQQLARRLAALEALSVLVSGATFSAQMVTKTFTTLANVEDTFAGGILTVAISTPGGANVTGVVVARMTVAGGDASLESVQVRSWTYAAGVITLNYVTGLEPSKAYTLSLLCVTY